jgi:hypothetical protein
MEDGVGEASSLKCRMDGGTLSGKWTEMSDLRLRYGRGEEAESGREDIDGRCEVWREK